MLQTAVKQKISRIVTTPVRWNCPLSGYTSFRIGGPADALVVVEKEEELYALLSFFAREKVKWRIIGKGTNLLVSDDGFAGVVVVLGKSFQDVKVRQQDAGSVFLQVGCALRLTRLAGWCLEKGLSGLEFASGIPGSVGGAVIMNAGAWGGEMSDVVTAVDVITQEGKQTIGEEELNFGYRSWHNSLIERELAVVTMIMVRLTRGDRPSMEEACSTYRQKRMLRQPQKIANAGSVFKNPPGDSAGRLIEASGLKGKQVGGAVVSTVHANFIVNEGQATAADIHELMQAITRKVKTDSNIDLEPEIHIL